MRSSKTSWRLLAAALVLTGGCGKSPTMPETPLPPGPPSPPTLTEKLVGRLFFHDFGPGAQLDIFMADLYLVPKEEGSSAARLSVRFPNANRTRFSARRGTERFPGAEVGGQYAGWNVDPHWKDDSTITWIHAQRMVEVNLNSLNKVSDVLPDWSYPQFDPVYSPDRTMLLFNTWISGKKNSFIKYLLTGVYASCLPQNYFSKHTDDNPTWVFSNTLISGHIFMAQKGRIYTRDLDSDAFRILTESQRDFRYVTPVLIETLVYLVFVDWSDPGHKTLWISSLDGSDLRALDATGDEPVFAMLGLPAAASEGDLERAALEYSLRFED